jgi:hypothetical protein
VLRALVEVDFDEIIANIFADTVLWSPTSEAYNSFDFFASDCTLRGAVHVI